MPLAIFHIGENETRVEARLRIRPGERMILPDRDGGCPESCESMDIVSTFIVDENGKRDPTESEWALIWEKEEELT